MQTKLSQPMKAAAFLSILSALATAALFCSSASANLALPKMEVQSQLTHEEVEIKISGDKGEVTGTFRYTAPKEGYYDLTLYLPVYAKEGAPEEEYKPDITMGDQKLEVHALRKEWADDNNIADFGKLPELEGQVICWFMVAHLPQQPEQKEYSLKIRYTQKLAGNKFIYTPLIPKQEKGKNYGSITVSADRPFRLLDEDKHSFASREAGIIVVHPSDKRAIVIEMAKAAPKIP